MRTQSLSDRDYELISAYLDDQIDLKQKKAVELRLTQDAQFKLAYEQLSETRKLLRSQPKLRAPRNYTLSPYTVSTLQPAARVFRPFPSLLRTVSALVSVFFVVLFGLNWFSAGRMMSSVPMESSEALFQAAPADSGAEEPLKRMSPSEEQPMAKSLTTSVPTPNVIYPPSGEIGGMGGGEGTNAVGEEAPLLAPYSGTVWIAPTATITSTLLAPAEEVGEITAQSEYSPSEYPYPDSQQPSQDSGTQPSVGGISREWLIKQILYGVLAVSFALIAIRYGKRQV